MRKPRQGCPAIVRRADERACCAARRPGRRSARPRPLRRRASVPAGTRRRAPSRPRVSGSRRERPSPRRASAQCGPGASAGSTAHPRSGAPRARADAGLAAPRSCAAAAWSARSTDRERPGAGRRSPRGPSGEQACEDHHGLDEDHASVIGGGKPESEPTPVMRSRGTGDPRSSGAPRGARCAAATPGPLMQPGRDRGIGTMSAPAGRDVQLRRDAAAGSRRSARPSSSLSTRAGPARASAASRRSLGPAHQTRERTPGVALTSSARPAWSARSTARHRPGARSGYRARARGEQGGDDHGGTSDHASDAPAVLVSLTRHAALPASAQPRPRSLSSSARAAATARANRPDDSASAHLLRDGDRLLRRGRERSCSAAQERVRVPGRRGRDRVRLGQERAPRRARRSSRGFPRDWPRSACASRRFPRTSSPGSCRRSRCPARRRCGYRSRCRSATTTRTAISATATASPTGDGSSDGKGYVAKLQVLLVGQLGRADVHNWGRDGGHERGVRGGRDRAQDARAGTTPRTR